MFDANILQPNLHRQLQYSTPVMNEALGTLRKLFKSEKAAIRHAAVKTAIELASAHHEAVISDLKNLLNDPVKVVIKEAKRGLEILAGIKMFNLIFHLVNDRLRESFIQRTNKRNRIL